MTNIDPDNLPSFQIPQNLLEQLYEFTGNASDASKGFFLCYTDQEGSPVILSKAGSQIIDMGIRKAVEKYLIDIENVDIPFDINGDQE
jgi:UDP-N-acetylmuramate-alanine ligase